MEDYQHQYPYIPMEKTGKIFRISIYTFLTNYQYFTTAAILAVPFSGSLLLLQALIPYSNVLPIIHNRLRALFYAAGFPPSSEFFPILSLKLSQSITSSIFLIPFTFSFLLFAKSSIIQALNNSHQKKVPKIQFSCLVSLYGPLFRTQICNSLLILSANATCFSILFIAFNFLEGLNLLTSSKSVLFFSATAAVLYSIIVANALIISNLAFVLSGMEKKGGYISILKACVMISGRNSTALSLALLLNMALAAVEGLFQYRVVAAYSHTGVATCSMALEWIFIAYLYSIFIVLDTIVTCVFFKSCKAAFRIEDQESRYAYRIEIAKEEEC